MNQIKLKMALQWETAKYQVTQQNQWPFEGSKMSRNRCKFANLREAKH